MNYNFLLKEKSERSGSLRKILSIRGSWMSPIVSLLPEAGEIVESGSSVEVSPADEIIYR